LDYIKNIFTNKTIIITTIIYIISAFILYFSIPQKLEKSALQDAKNNGIIILNTLESARHNYNNVAEKIQKKYPDIKFTTSTDIKNGIPYPASFLHSLNKDLSKGDIKIQLYSAYPFKGTESYNRKLSNRQLENLKHLREFNGLKYEMVTKENKKYYVISKVDYMLNNNCIKCHNSHKNRTQDFNWKIGDPRGILEIEIPIDSNLQTNIDYFKISLLLSTIFLIISSLSYYSYNIIKIKREAAHENKKINDGFKQSFKELNFENEELESELKEMREIFDEYIIYSKTDLFGIITDVSTAFCNLSGYSREELVGSDHNIVRHPDMKASVFKGMWSTIENDKVWIGDVKNFKKDGGYYWVHAIVSPNYDKEGIKIGYISIRQDITEKMDKMEKIRKEKI